MEGSRNTPRLQQWSSSGRPVKYMVAMLYQPGMRPLKLRYAQTLLSTTSCGRPPEQAVQPSNGFPSRLYLWGKIVGVRVVVGPDIPERRPRLDDPHRRLVISRK
eukprot:4783568-Pleurochrysis_carterae.AAC.3